MKKPAPWASKAWFRSAPMRLTRLATEAYGSKVKCLHREEFVVVGWTDPEGTRPPLGALLLAYYDPDGRLVLTLPTDSPRTKHERIVRSICSGRHA